MIASYFPISRKVHQVRAIISRERDAERGEWITTQPFARTTTTTTAQQIDNLQSLFTRLAGQEPWANADGYSPDFEESVRRSMRFRVEDTEICAFLPRRSLWDDLDVTPEGVDAFNAAWTFVWQCAGTSLATIAKSVDLKSPALKTVRIGINSDDQSPRQRL